MRPRLTVVLMGVVAACGGADGPRYTQGAMVVFSPAAWRTTLDGPITIGFRLANTGQANEVLRGVSLAGGERLELHTGGESGMERLDSLFIAPGGVIQLGLGGHHVMTGDVPVVALPGDTLSVVLAFAGAGRLVVPVPVLRFSEARELLGH
jgi:copper(I)-binding protein